MWQSPPNVPFNIKSSIKPGYWVLSHCMIRLCVWVCACMCLCMWFNLWNLFKHCILKKLATILNFMEKKRCLEIIYCTTKSECQWATIYQYNVFFTNVAFLCFQRNVRRGPELAKMFCFVFAFFFLLIQNFLSLYTFLKEMWIPDHLICLLRNLYAGQEATVRTGHETTDWFQTGKGVHQGCILSPCLFNLYAEYITRNVGLEEAQAGIKIAGRNINNLRYADDTTLMENEEELKSLLMKVKEECWKVGLKLNSQKTKIMASSPITSWEIDGKTVETMADFIFLGSKITADGDCSHEIKERLEGKI